MTSGFDDKNIKGMYLDLAPSAFDDSRASRLGILSPSDRATENYGFLGANPSLRQWLGARQAAALNKKQYNITNVPYEATLAIPQSQLNRDKSGLLRARMASFSRDAVAGHWLKLQAALVVANGYCYDGKTFFATDHSLGASGTQVNDCGATQVPASNINTTTAATPTEMANTVLQTVAHMMTFKNDQGELVNADASRFHVQVATVAHYSALVQALTANYLTATADNPLKGLQAGGISFEYSLEPRITGATEMIFVYRIDNALKPFIWQEEKSPEVDVLGPGSDHWFNHKEYLLGVDCSRAAGYGLWEYAARVTFT